MIFFTPLEVKQLFSTNFRQILLASRTKHYYEFRFLQINAYAQRKGKLLFTYRRAEIKLMLRGVTEMFTIPSLR